MLVPWASRKEFVDIILGAPVGVVCANRDSYGAWPVSRLMSGRRTPMRQGRRGGLRGPDDREIIRAVEKHGESTPVVVIVLRDAAAYGTEMHLLLKAPHASQA